MVCWYLCNNRLSGGKEAWICCICQFLWSKYSLPADFRPGYHMTPLEVKVGGGVHIQLCLSVPGGPVSLWLG